MRREGVVMLHARWTCLALLLALCAPAGAGPEDGGAGGADTGVPAPAGCWTMSGGSPARSGASRTQDLGGRLVEAWTRELGRAGAAVDDEPRVWHERVYVTLRDGGSRTLLVVGLGDGRDLAEPVSFATPVSLELSVWNDVALVRAAPDRLEAWRLRGGKQESFWSATTERAFHSPILLGDLVYALDGGDVVCWSLGMGREAWRRAGSYRGQLAVRGGDLYALLVDEVGNAQLAPFDRVTGTPGPPIFVSSVGRGSQPPEGDLAEVCVLDRAIFARFPDGVRTQSGKPANTSWTLRYAGSSTPAPLIDNGLLDYTRVPVEAGDGWLVTETDEETRLHQLELSTQDAKQPTRMSFYVLAQGPRHEGYHRVAVPFTVAGGVAWAGARAFGLESRRILWEGAADPVVRPVPAHGTLLVVPADRTLTALRREDAVAAGATFFGPAAGIGSTPPPAALPSSGLVFFVDDSAHEGAFEIAGDGTKLTTLSGGAHPKRVTRDMHRVTFVLGPDGGLLYSSAPDGLEHALRRYHYLSHAEDYYKLAKDAYKTYDPALQRGFVTEALARGVPEKKLKLQRQQIEGLERTPRKVNETLREKLLARAHGFVVADAVMDLKAAESPLDDPRWDVQRAYARRLLAGHAHHAKAAALVRARLPGYIPAPDPFVPLEWIDFVDQLQGTPVERLVAPTGERKDLTRLDREYGSALETWRKDLVALQADELLILTPLAKPGRIAGCLSMGTLVCKALGAVFRDGTKVRTDPWPLILRLYEDQKEYLAASVDPGASQEERKQMEWTGGHYDPQAGLSRIYLPPRPDAWQETLSTYAHELTHHWIDERCPLFEAREGKSTGLTPGYWIVEGMATLVEEFRWDLARRTWDTVNPRADSLDTVANAQPGQLHPWSAVYNMDALAFQRLKRYDPDRKVPMRWRLGYHQLVSESGMFYAQAAATCHYLFHAGEKERKALLEYVRQYYTGRLPPKQESIQNVFGIPPAELGARVVAYAKRMNETH